MKENHKIYMLILIFILMTIMRIYVDSLEPDISILIMSSINIVALLYIISLIICRTYDRINELLKSSKGKLPCDLGGCIVNNYKTKAFFFMVVLIIIGCLYVIFYRDMVINDMLTIATLIISVEDETFIKKICNINLKKNLNVK